MNDSPVVLYFFVFVGIFGFYICDISLPSIYVL